MVQDIDIRTLDNINMDNMIMKVKEERKVDQFIKIVTAGYQIVRHCQ